MTATLLRVLLAGGGTGGHVIPAIALAEEIVSRGGEARFVGTVERIEARLVPEAGFGIDFISAQPLAGGGPGRLALGLAAVPFAVLRAMRLVRALGPNVVIGVGGYVAGPVVLAAKLLGIPTAVLEQNATVGLANKLLARLVTRAFVSYRETISAFPAGRVQLSGNPLRRAILEARGSRKRGKKKGLINVLVMGGSQGALAIDQRVPAAMELAELGGEVAVLHQCGGGRTKEVLATYRDAGIAARTLDFIDDTAMEFKRADLVVARAGATTVCELTAMGLPAVFLPYPHHADRQQEKNAAPMIAAGAAVSLDERSTGVDEMAEAIATFVRDETRLRTAASASASLAKPDAAQRIVDGLEVIVRGAR